ncbi:hypothetical protein os1_32550 [Comamonadaceae bacterium OS-1]|nr:hypothetical protein os1_32550 [Comamonadaceae bacterium OS-1]
MCAMPELWPWSSYHATIGTAVAPEWLHTAWLLSQFSTSGLAHARATYANHVRAGIGLPTVWESLTSQFYLGDEDFAQQLQTLAPRKAAEREIPRTQRRVNAPPLAHFTAQAERNSAMAQAYATGCYSLKEIATAFGVHYATVSRAVRGAELARGGGGNLGA